MKYSKIQYRDMELFVSNDYWMEDGIRMPVGLSKAFSIAEETDSLLPTKFVVDAIWNQADIKLTPKALPPTHEMTTLTYFRLHNQKIEDQLKDVDNVEDLLIAGHKKDILYIDPSSLKVAIYGWHRSNGKPIQPYSTVHHREYKDYSHGLRLISKTALKNGKEIRIRQENL